MSKTLNMAEKLKLPASIGTETVGILGRRGSGKSNTGTVLIEELIGIGAQVVLIDPKGEGWGLKARGADSAGKDVIVFGEPEGDLPLREEHAETVADFVVTSGRSVVLSLNGFESQASERRFVTRFCERFYALKRKPEHHSQVMVVLEEASLFVPQRVDGEHAKMVSNIQRLVRQGRSFGIGVTLIDQRPASVNKDVLTQVEVMICHQLTSPHDRKAVDAWIEANANKADAEEFRKTLPTLQPGECWVWSPAKLRLFERATIRRRSTFDSGSTPVLGKGAANRPEIREVNLEALKTQLEKVVAEKKANDPAELKKKVGALEAELKRLKALVTASPIKAMADKPLITDAALERLERLNAKSMERSTVATKTIEGLVERLRTAVAPVQLAITDEHLHVAELLAMVKTLKGLRNVSALPVSVSPRVLTAAQAMTARGDSPFQRKPVPDWPGKSYDEGQTFSAPEAANPSAREELKKPQRRIVDAIAWWNSIGVQSPSRLQVGFVAGIKPTGGHFSNSIGPLSTGGLIEARGDGVALTSAGAAVAVPPAQAADLPSYYRMIRALLKTGAMQRIFDAVIGNGGVEIAVDRIGEITSIDPSGGHFSNSIGPLSTLGLIDRRQGVVFPTALLFPEGL